MRRARPFGVPPGVAPGFDPGVAPGVALGVAPAVAPGFAPAAASSFTSTAAPGVLHVGRFLFAICRFGVHVFPFGLKPFWLESHFWFNAALGFIHILNAMGLLEFREG